MPRRFDSGPAGPVDVSISEEPPIAPVAVSFESDPRRQGSTLQPPASSGRPSGALRLLGWCVDSSLLLALLGGHVFIAARLADDRYWLDLVLAMPLLWGALLGCLALAGSWLFVALCARTPGMALTGQRLRSRHGGAPRPVAAFVRALFAVVFGVPALFGFVLALFDRRGQTLHDKLTRCVVSVD